MQEYKYLDIQKNIFYSVHAEEEFIYIVAVLCWPSNESFSQYRLLSCDSRR